VTHKVGVGPGVPNLFSAGNPIAAELCADTAQDSTRVL
jgi:hypothetical protein